MLLLALLRVNALVQAHAEEIGCHHSKEREVLSVPVSHASARGP